MIDMGRERVVEFAVVDDEPVASRISRSSRTSIVADRSRQDRTPEESHTSPSVGSREEERPARHLEPEPWHQ